MDEEILEEKEWSVAEYLAVFDAAAPDHALIRQRAASLERIVVRRVRAASGRMFEDTVFTEKSGRAYSVREAL